MRNCTVLKNTTINIFIASNLKEYVFREIILQFAADSSKLSTAVWKRPIKRDHDF